MDNNNKMTQNNNSLLSAIAVSSIAIAIVLIVFIFCCIPINTKYTNLLPSISATALFILSAIITIFTIIHYFKKLFDKYAEDIEWKKKVDRTQDRIEKHLHWIDVGFEVEFELQRKIIKHLDVSEKDIDEMEDAISSLIMKRLPTDNPYYKDHLHLKEYLRTLSEELKK